MSRSQTFRRIAAPIAVVLALGLLARTSCQQKEREPVRFVLDFGDRAPEVRHVRVDLWDGDTSTGWFERDFDAGGATRRVDWRQPVSGHDLDATIDLTLASGSFAPRRVHLHVEPGGTTVIEPL